VVDIVVCGPARSGTSLMAQCLVSTGIRIAGDALIEADEANIHGYYESVAFRNVVRRIIRWRRSRLTRYTGLTSLAVARHVSSLSQLMNRPGTWVWKYPNAVFVLSDIRRASPSMVVVMMRRPRSSVIRSMRRHARIKGGRTHDDAVYGSWYDRAFQSYEAYKGTKTIVEFRELVDDPQRAVTGAMRRLGFKTRFRIRGLSPVDKKEVHF